MSKKILVTGAAGFIGSALSIRLLERGDEVVGIDNHNDYYDPAPRGSGGVRYSLEPPLAYIDTNLVGFGQTKRERTFSAINTTQQCPTKAKCPHYSVLAAEKIKQKFNLTEPYWRGALRNCLNVLTTDN